MTNITAVLSNFMYRRNAERVDTEEPEDVDEGALTHDASDNNSIVDEVEEAGGFLGFSTADELHNESVRNNLSENSQRTFVVESLPDDENVNTDSDYDNETANIRYATNNESPGNGLPPNTDSHELIIAQASPEPHHRTVHGLTLRNLEDEREIVQRRTGGCVLLSSFVLLRLWVQAVMTGDFGLLLLCLVFTSWTARFVRYTRDREEELNRMINEWDETTEEEPSINDARLRRMSFQSQLALAIMQSQIQVMEGGYGHPDGGENRPGVDEDAKGNWERFEYKSIASLTQREEYGFVAGQKDESEEDDSSNGGPTCSICLCEYEKGEKLVSLPCKHVFHEDCITLWTNHNTRCPLCNTDLEATSGSHVSL